MRCNGTDRFSPDCTAEEVSEAFKHDGYAIIEKVLDAASLQRLRSELDPWIDNTDFGNEAFWGHDTKRFGALVAKSKVAQEMLTHPTGRDSGWLCIMSSVGCDRKKPNC